MLCKWRDLPGPRELRKFFEKRDSTQVALADRLGVTPSAVYFWTIGFRRPHSDEARLAVERLTGVHRDSWLTPKERAARRRLRAA